MTLMPGRYTVAAGAAIAFNPICKDQSGAYLAGATMSWSTSGGGIIDQTGKYTANAAPSNGPHLIICAATFNGKTIRDTSLVIVSRAKIASLHKRIDCGANNLLPAGWETDDAYVSGGSDGANLSTVTATGAAMAPADVYKSFRRGSPHSYTVPLLWQGEYTVRLHFADWKDTARSMSYSILGANVLNAFRISSLAGGANKALALDFSAVVQSANGLSIAATASSGEVFEAGFEVMQNLLQSVTLVSPLGGQKYSVGQTVQIQFRMDTLARTQVYLKLSVDNGRTFQNFTGNYGINKADYGATWGTYNWTIPDSLDKNGGGSMSTVSTLCRIRIEPYQPLAWEYDVSDSAFTIAPKTQTAAQTRPGFTADRLAAAAFGRWMIIHASSSRPFRVDVFAFSGKRMASFKGEGQQDFTLPQPPAGGIALVRMVTAKGVNMVTRIATPQR
jgi:hypothetical protein